MEKMRIATQVSYQTTTLISRDGRVDLLPQARGRDAFWLGRPIWANPLTGDPARQWSAGWHEGFSELQRQCGESNLPDADGSPAWQALVRAHRH